MGSRLQVSDTEQTLGGGTPVRSPWRSKSQAAAAMRVGGSERRRREGVAAPPGALARQGRGRVFPPAAEDTDAKLGDVRKGIKANDIPPNHTSNGGKRRHWA